MSEVTYNHVQAATAILSRIAFSGGEDSDPAATLAVWRATEGFDNDALERAARESARDSIDEIEAAIRDGESFTTEQLGEYLEREFLTALQIGWIVRARHEKRAEEGEKAGD